jgi:hypothetical protein
MKARAIFAAAAAYLVLSLATTFPLALDPAGATVLGGDTADIYSHLWNYWWVGGSFADGTGFPLRMDLINHPTGGALFCTDGLNALYAAALQRFMGPTLVFNIVPHYELMLAALGAFLLAYSLTARASLAFIAGVAYGFSPLMLSHGLASGIFELGHNGWIPLSLMFAIRTVRHQGWLNPILGAVCSALASLSYLFCGFLLALTLGVFGIYWLVSRGRPVHFSLAPAPTQGPHPSRRSGLIRLSVLALLALALNLPLAATFLGTIRADDSILPQGVFSYRASLDEEFGPENENARACHLAEYLLPGKDRLVTTHFVNTAHHTVYLGLLVLGLTAASLAVRRRFMLFWWGLLCTGVLLSLGPYLLLAPGVHLGGPWSPLYILLFRYFPFFTLVLEPFRFAFLATLATAVMATAGAAHITRSWPRRWSTAFGITAGLIIWAEFILLSPAAWPLPRTELSTPAAYEEFANVPGEFAILELPMWREGSDLMVKEYFYWQTTHGKATAHAIHGLPPPYLLANPFTRHLLNLERDRPKFPPTGQVERVLGYFDLKEDGFDYIVLHERFFEPGALARVTEAIAFHVPDYREVGDGVRLYSLRSTAASGDPGDPRVDD